MRSCPSSHAGSDWRHMPGRYPQIAGRLSLVWACWRLLTLLVCPVALAQPYWLDRTFRPSVTASADSTIRALAVQPDGRVLIGGRFEAVQGVSATGIARLLPDGHVDPAFEPGQGVSGTLHAIVVQSDGKIVLAGGLASLDGQARPGLGRLLTNGAVDSEFVPDISGAHFTSVYAAAARSDGRLLVGGDFDRVGGLSRRGVAELDPDGGVHAAFDPGEGIAGEFAAVWDLAVQPDGKVLIAGDFSAVAGVDCQGLARLEADGTLDAAFDPQLQVDGASVFVSQVALQDDGKILIVGTFTRVQGVGRAGLARLDPDGRLDTSFDPGAGVGGGAANLVAAVPQADGVLILGDFASFDGVGRNDIVRLLTSGRLDFGFTPMDGLGEIGGMMTAVNAAALQPDGKMLVAATWGTSRGTELHVVRIEEDGRVDGGFHSQSVTVEMGGVVYSMLAGQCDQMLVGGDFERLNGIARPALARVNADGTLDAAFDAHVGPGGIVYTLATNTVGRLLVGGLFSGLAGKPWVNVGRLMPDGRPDESFSLAGITDGAVYCLLPQEDGRMLVGGNFRNLGGQQRMSLARLLENGEVDTIFNPKLEASLDVPEVYAMAQGPDGSVLVGGYFDRVATRQRAHLTRLRSDGTPDPSYSPMLVFGGELPVVLAMAVMPDGRVLVGGAFETVNGVPRHGVARLNSNGTLDTSFDPGDGLSGNLPEVTCLLLQADGGIVIGGEFDSFNQQPLWNVARLNADGSLDAMSSALLGFDRIVNSVVACSSGSLTFGGGFKQGCGRARLGLARVRPSTSRLRIGLDGGAPVISWEGAGRLETTDSIHKSWSVVPEAASPFQVPQAAPMGFYRLATD